MTERYHLDRAAIDEALAGFPQLNRDELMPGLTSQMEEFNSRLDLELSARNPYRKHHQTLKNAENDFNAHGATRESIHADAEHYRQLKSDADTRFWENKANEITRENKASPRLTIDDELQILRKQQLGQWKKDYETLHQAWQQDYAENARKQYLDALLNRLESLDQLQETFAQLGVGGGILADSSLGDLNQRDIAELQQWAHYLKNDKGVQRLCELMGRMRRAEKSERIETIIATREYTITIPDKHSKEEITGITLGRDLENLVPQELALMGDPDLSILFDLKYIESRLVCFEKQGWAEQAESEQYEEETTVADEDKLGPIIICVDTSGSMSGEPEDIAKALTLSLCMKSREQQRNCYLINFSTSIITLDLTPPKGIPDLMRFLQTSFGGGTEITPALQEGIRMMKKGSYSKADLLVISDFGIGRIPEHILEDCQAMKAQENRFYALDIGSGGSFFSSSFHGFSTGNDELFDKRWEYDTGSKRAREINTMAKEITGPRH